MPLLLAALHLGRRPHDAPQPLRDRALFAQAAVDSFGAICWPNGADLAPDALHVRL